MDWWESRRGVPHEGEGDGGRDLEYAGVQRCGRCLHDVLYRERYRADFTGLGRYPTHITGALVTTVREHAAAVGAARDAAAGAPTP